MKQESSHSCREASNFGIYIKAVNRTLILNDIFKMEKMNNSKDDYPDDSYFLYELHGKETKLLADLSGIEMDLHSTVQLCRTVLKLMMENEKTDFFLINALTTAALIKYFRCFTKAARNRIPKEYIDSLPTDLKRKHNYIINFRNKYIAHSVNVFEDNHVSLEVFEDSNGGKKVHGITVGGAYIGGLAYHHLLDLITLCDKLLLKIGKKCVANRIVY